MIIISSLCFFLCLIYVMRYNLHMFQLNGYKNDEHLVWIKKNLKKQGALGTVVLAFFLNLFQNNIILSIIEIVIALICIKYYSFLKKAKVKKQLVYTARVKRLIFSEIVLAVVVFILVYIMKLRVNAYLGIIMSFIVMQPFLMIIINILNAPVEKMIKQYYINDAKKILKKNKELIVIGVTGSFGKTSVKFYLESLLKEKYNVLVTPESYNTPMGVVKTIRESLKSTHEIFICEMGARRVGEIKEICDIVHPTHGIITAVGPQHLETFLSIENILNTKFELADALAENGQIFLNGDNEMICKKSTSYKNVNLYSSGEEGTYRVHDISLSQSGTRFMVTTEKGESCEFQTRLVGEHNVLNILAAIAVANKLGIELGKLRIPVRRIQSVPHRLQVIEKGAVTIIDDAFNSNPTGSKIAVETLKLFDGLRILITPGMVELGKMEQELNYQFGSYAAHCCDYIFLVGKKRTEPIKNGIMAENFEAEKCMAFDSFNDAMAKAMTLVSEQHKYILIENDLPDNY